VKDAAVFSHEELLAPEGVWADFIACFKPQVDKIGKFCG